MISLKKQIVLGVLAFIVITTLFIGIWVVALSGHSKAAKLNSVTSEQVLEAKL